MPYRLHVANLRNAAASKGDTSDYKIMKRTGISKSAFYKLIGQQVEPTVTSLKRFTACYEVTLDGLLLEIDAGRYAKAS